MKYYVGMDDGTPAVIMVVVYADTKTQAMDRAMDYYPGWVSKYAFDQEDYDLQLAEEQIAAGERAADEIYCSYYDSAEDSEFN